MIQKNRGERFVSIGFPFVRKKEYALSNHGRLVAFTESLADGEEINCKRPDGINIYLTTYPKDGKKIAYRMNIAKAVAEIFCNGMTDEKCELIHLDHNKSNDHYENLKWVTPEERLAHLRNSPAVIEAKARIVAGLKVREGSKLTSTQVLRIRKLFDDPKGVINMKRLAKKYGISVSHLHDIKKNKVWKRVTL